MEKPKVGDVLYSLNVGNATRNQKQELTEITVTQVGRKYFTCKGEGHDKKYFISDWKQFTGGHPLYSVLYKTRQIWEDERETNHLCKTISETFEYGHNRLKFSLEKLRKIADIINSKEE